MSESYFGAHSLPLFWRRVRCHPALSSRWVFEYILWGARDSPELISCAVWQLTYYWWEFRSLFAQPFPYECTPFGKCDWFGTPFLPTVRSVSPTYGADYRPKCWPDTPPKPTTVSYSFSSLLRPTSYYLTVKAIIGSIKSCQWHKWLRTHLKVVGLTIVGHFVQIRVRVNQIVSSVGNLILYQRY